MKKILLILMVLLWVTSAWSGWILDNGSGGVDDSVAIEWNALDNNGNFYLATWDSVYICHIYHGVDSSYIFWDTLTTGYSNFDYTSPNGTGYAGKFFRHRRLSSTSSSVGAYGVKVIAVEGNVAHTLAEMNYQVNDVGLGDFLVLGDTGSCKASVSGLMEKGDSSTCKADVSTLMEKSDSSTCKADVTALSTFDASTDRVIARDTLANGDTIAVMPSHWVSADSNAYQGAAGSGLDSSEVYESVIAALQADSASIDTGSSNWWGNSISGGPISDGTEPETLIVLNADDSTLIQGAKVTIRTIDQSTTKTAGLTTDVNGRLVLALDADSFWVEVAHNNYTQVTDTLVIVSGGGTDSLFMNQFSPGDPADPDLCRVYGWVYDISGDNLAEVEINAEIPRSFHPVKYGNIVITPYSKSTVTDSTGYWYLDLFPSEDLSSKDTEYLFTIKYGSGVIYRIETVVPDSTSWQLQ